MADGVPARGTSALMPLLVDVGLPLASYYVLRAGFGLPPAESLTASSVLPAARTAGGLVTRRRLNALAAVMLAANLTGAGVSLVTGGPRVMLAKDPAVTCVIAIAILISVGFRRPLGSAVLEPVMTEDSAAKIAAWDRLSAGCPRFRRMEMLFSTIWGVTLLAGCAARLIAAFTLPVPAAAQLSGFLAASAAGVAFLVAGLVAGQPIGDMIGADAGPEQAVPARGLPHGPPGSDGVHEPGQRAGDVMHAVVPVMNEAARPRGLGDDVEHDEEHYPEHDEPPQHPITSTGHGRRGGAAAASTQGWNLHRPAGAGVAEINP